jgi:hypothetical protein
LGLLDELFKSHPELKHVPPTPDPFVQEARARQAEAVAERNARIMNGANWADLAAVPLPPTAAQLRAAHEAKEKEKADIEAGKAREATFAAEVQQGRASVQDLEKQIASKTAAERRQKIDAEMRRRGLEPTDPSRPRVIAKMAKRGAL